MVLALVVASVDVVLVPTALARPVLRLRSVAVAAAAVRDTRGSCPAYEQRCDEQRDDARLHCGSRFVGRVSGHPRRPLFSLIRTVRGVRNYLARSCASRTSASRAAASTSTFGSSSIETWS